MYKLGVCFLCEMGIVLKNIRMVDSKHSEQLRNVLLQIYINKNKGIILCS